MACRSERKKAILKRQSGVSTLTGEPIEPWMRLEEHHRDELCLGGDRGRKNEVVIPIQHHLIIHLQRSQDASLSVEQRAREFDTVRGRIRELTDREMKEYGEIVDRLGLPDVRKGKQRPR